MPSHESPLPTRAEANDALYVALVEVCEKSFFAFVESCDATRFTALVNQVVTDATASEDGAHEAQTAASLEWLKASVAFDGTLLKGVVEVCLPKRLAYWLVASLLGISREVELREVQLVDDQVFDGIGEFANMLCGAWLTDLRGNPAFGLGSPTVTRLPLDWSPVADFTPEHGGHRLCVNELPMQIQIRSSTD